jgi:FMN phosphatase YigB (HAD superfamily)
VAAAEFLPQFTSWTRGFFPGATDLLVALRPHFRLACLSNCNASHWGRNEEIGILREFEVALSSHQLGCHKPEPAIFEKALAALRADAETVTFFDDSAANVEAARDAGMRAVQVRGIQELSSALTGSGLLPSQGPRH